VCLAAGTIAPGDLLEEKEMVRETLCHGDYAVNEEKRSEIDVGVPLSVYQYTKCPKCKMSLGKIGHGRKGWCGCGLRYELHGNALVCEI